MRRINPQKLLRSKWTARYPQNRERHFMVTECHEDQEGLVLEVDLEAVLTKRVRRLPWRALTDEEAWQQGWK